MNEDTDRGVQGSAEATPLPGMAEYDDWLAAHSDLKLAARTKELHRLVAVLFVGAVVSVAASAVLQPSAGAVLFGGLLLGAGVVNVVRAGWRVVNR